MLIVIEGLDGSGKSTQVKNVHRFLEEKIGGKVHYLHFPRFDAPVGCRWMVRGPGWH